MAAIETKKPGPFDDGFDENDFVDDSKDNDPFASDFDLDVPPPPEYKGPESGIYTAVTTEFRREYWRNKDGKDDTKLYFEYKITTGNYLNKKVFHYLFPSAAPWAYQMVCEAIGVPKIEVNGVMKYRLNNDNCVGKPCMVKVIKKPWKDQMGNDSFVANIDRVGKPNETAIRALQEEVEEI